MGIQGYFHIWELFGYHPSEGGKNMNKMFDRIYQIEEVTS